MRTLDKPAFARGLGYSKPRPLLFTRARLVLLQGAGEEEFTREIKRCAHYYGWMGVHTRYSQGVVESIHSVRLDGFSEAMGVPDWFFWHEQWRQSFYAELKGASGHLSPYQKRQFPSLRRAGLIVFEWYPRDATTAEHIFREGLAA